MAGLLVLLGFSLAACKEADTVKESKSAEPKALKAPPKKAKRNKAYRKVDNPNIKVTDLGARTIPIIDIHEHLQTMDEAKRLLKAMDGFNIKRTCLMSSSHYTFTLDNQYGFERFKENNDLLIEVKKTYLERFCAFVTIHPPDENNLKLLQDYVAAGADGRTSSLSSTTSTAATGSGSRTRSPGARASAVAPSSTTSTWTTRTRPPSRPASFTPTSRSAGSGRAPTSPTWRAAAPTAPRRRPAWCRGSRARAAIRPRWGLQAACRVPVAHHVTRPTPRSPGFEQAR